MRVLWLHCCCGEWEAWARKPLNHTSWVAVVTYLSRSAIAVYSYFLVALFALSLCRFDIWHFCWYRDFCHRTKSGIFLFHLDQFYMANLTHFVGKLYWKRYNVGQFCSRVVPHMSSANWGWCIQILLEPFYKFCDFCFNLAQKFRKLWL